MHLLIQLPAMILQKLPWNGCTASSMFSLSLFTFQSSLSKNILENKTRNPRLRSLRKNKDRNRIIMNPTLVGEVTRIDGFLEDQLDS